MDIKEYISSGILELYVLGQLSPEESAEVEGMQAKYVEVKKEIYDISISLEQYGRLSAIKVPAGLEDKIFSQLPPKTNTIASPPANVEPPMNWKMISFAFGLTSILGIGMYMWQSKKHELQLSELNKTILACDSIQQASNIQFALLDNIYNPNNKIIELTPTANYAGIVIYLHHNEESKKNYLQLNQLPEITADQAFQLWSLKPGLDPIPMDVFTSRNKVIEIGFEDETPTYAITIEPKGGSKSPSLDKLIGTMSI